MKQIFFFSIAFFQLNACFSQEAPLKLHADLAVKADAYIKQYLALDIFSGVVLLAKNEKPVYLKAFGMANREEKLENTPETKFDIGSINKVFTKAVILQLIQEGKIQPDDKLGKFLKGFPAEAADKVTVQQLLSHRSGFGDYLREPGFFKKPKSEQTIAAIMELIKGMPLLFEPGTGQEYSNAGYILLGGIIEAATGKSFYANIKERIIDALGMKNTVVDEAKEKDANRAIGYLKNMRGMLENNEGILMVPTPAGGFITTASDLLKFFQAYFYSNTLVTEAGLKHDEFYSFIEKARENGRAIPIAGGFQGANAVVYNLLRDSVTIIVLANMDEPVAEQLASGIFSIIKGKKPDKPALPAMQTVYQSFKVNGIDYVKKNFNELTRNFSPMEPKDNLLNNIGYNLLFAGETEDALQIFKLNTELFPQIANVWDSYGEALLKKGDKKAALSAYKKALEIKPGLPSAIAAVRKLEKEK